jgi:hypothetical protein
MSAAVALLEELRERDVRLVADGLMLRVDAPAGVLTEGVRRDLAEAKPQILKLLHRERKKLEEGDHRGLVIRWSKEPGWISLHDPTTGDWHDVKASECPLAIVEYARANRRMSSVR